MAASRGSRESIDTTRQNYSTTGRRGWVVNTIHLGIVLAFIWPLRDEKVVVHIRPRRFPKQISESKGINESDIPGHAVTLNV